MKPKACSPIAHITNIEVNGLMLKLSWDCFVTSAYSKFVYGRAHTHEGHGVRKAPAGSDGRYPYAKGKALNGAGTADDVNATSSGSAELLSLGLKVDGVGEEINDFLDNTTLFASVAYTQYDAKSGHTILNQVMVEARMVSLLGRCYYPRYDYRVWKIWFCVQLRFKILDTYDMS